MPAKRDAASESSLRVGDYYIWDLYDATRQTTHWKTRDGRIMRLVDMETDHLEKVAFHLMASRYRVLAFEEARYLLEGAAAPWAGHDDVEYAWQAVLESDPLAWLQRTPLWAALAAELARRGKQIPSAPGEEKNTPERMRSEAFMAIVSPVMASLSNKGAGTKT
jgi:hypothetical protein